VTRPVLRVGHKGADALAPGNTLASFERAVAAGVDVIELDVLRPRGDFNGRRDWRNAPAGPAPGSGPLLVAHDWADAERREPLTLAEALDAFTRPPLHEVRINLDLKLAGREDEVVRLLRERELVGRAMVSTMERRSLYVLAQLEPGLPRGWTLPRVRRDWISTPWARPFLAGGVASLRARLPRIVRRGVPGPEVWATWVYHPLITPRLVRAAHQSGVALIAWTVDERAAFEALVEMGVDGVCTNDPRLFEAV
jgi:glycerophosphoryl diester phosphodiesterase